MSSGDVSERGGEDLRAEEGALRDEVARLLEEARRQGASDAEVAVTRSLGFSVTVRQGELETVEFTRDAGFGVTVYDGQRTGSASTTVVDARSARDVVAKALQIARHADADDCAGIGAPELMAQAVPDLDLHHDWGLDVSAAEAIARSCEAAATGADARIANSEGASVSTFQAARAYGNTAGFLGSECGTRHSIGVSVIAGEGAAMQRDYWYGSSRRPGALEAPDVIGLRAAQRAVARLDARSVPTAEVPVLYASEIAGSLIGHLLSAISGGALYRRGSFLCDALGEQLFPERITLDERPHLAAGVGSSAFDGDGLPTRAKAIIENGRLASYLLSVYSARRLGLESTANCGGVHNLFVSDDGLDGDALLAEMDRGLLVTELMGQGVNQVTGDYSRGAAGFWVEDGRIVHPVQEVTVAGNLRDMFAGIRAVGADVEREANVRCGSLLVDGMTVAGA